MVAINAEGKLEYWVYSKEQGCWVVKPVDQLPESVSNIQKPVEPEQPKCKWYGKLIEVKLSPEMPDRAFTNEYTATQDHMTKICEVWLREIHQARKRTLREWPTCHLGGQVKIAAIPRGRIYVSPRQIRWEYYFHYDCTCHEKPFGGAVRE
jgi:hypothetical protein